VSVHVMSMFEAHSALIIEVK